MNMESWRTVHALQLERGVSSVVVASNGERYREQLDQVRQGSDEAVKASEAASFYDALKAERVAVDQALRGAPAVHHGALDGAAEPHQPAVPRGGGIVLGGEGAQVEAFLVLLLLQLLVVLSRLFLLL